MIKAGDKFTSKGKGSMSILKVNDNVVVYVYDFLLNRNFTMTFNDFMARFKNLLTQKPFE